MLTKMVIIFYNNKETKYLLKVIFFDIASSMSLQTALLCYAKYYPSYAEVSSYEVSI